MPRFVEKPSVVEAVGNVPKVIEEYVGRVNTGTEGRPKLRAGCGGRCRASAASRRPENHCDISQI